MVPTTEIAAGLTASAGSVDPALAERLLDQQVAMAAAGDAVALRGLYDAIAPKVAAYLRLRGAEDPDGLTNDVFMAVYLRLRDLRGGWQGFRALAFTVAHARLVDERRRRAARPKQTEYDPEVDRRLSASAEESAMAVDGGEVAALLDLLPADQREVVVLRVLADLSVEQTAAVVGCAVGRVAKLQGRALKALRALLHQRDDIGGGAR